MQFSKQVIDSTWKDAAAFRAEKTLTLRPPRALRKVLSSCGRSLFCQLCQTRVW